MSNLASDYDEKFYEYNVIGSLRSAKLVLALLHDKFKFTSVADLGCGRGTWLRASLDLGASRVLGYDGVWNEGKVDQNIDFISCDLENLDIDDERFDLAISLEVAEHLSEGKADQFIDALVKNRMPSFLHLHLLGSWGLPISMSSFRVIGLRNLKAEVIIQ